MLLRLIACTATVFVSTAFCHQYIFEKISMDMETKTVVKGKAAKITASIYYTMEGKMTSYYNEPVPLVVTNTRKGEITIYNIRNNTVSHQENYIFSTETNQLYYFLDNKKTDLGLISLGYSIVETKFEDGLKITRWKPPVSLQSEISLVELVHEKANPIYIAYFNKKNLPLKKIYFYNYMQLSGTINLPRVVTQINFSTEKDSSVMKTTYSNFKLNQAVENDKLDFKIPPDAKVIK
jgi:hypothetical protein